MGRDPRAPYVLLAVVAVLAGVGLVGAGTVVETTAGASVVLSSVAAVAVGLRRNLRLSVPRRALTVSAVLFAVGFAIRAAAPADPTAAVVADVCSFSGYGLLVTFLVAVVRRVRAATGLLLLMDAAVATLGLAVVAWTTLVSPSLTADVSGAYRILLAAYVGADLLLIALAVQLTLRQVARVPAFWLLMTGLTCLLVGDLGYAAEAIDLLSAPDRVFAVWHLGAFGLLGAMSLDRSVGALFRAAPSASPGLQRGRAVVLFVALVAPTVLLPMLPASGAVDFWVRLVGYVALVVLVFLRTWLTTVKLAHSQAETLSQRDHDALTGLLSRPALLDALGGQLGRRRDADAGEPLHVLFVDVDGFKAVNDTWGHPAGDTILAEAAERMRRAVGDRVVGRVGGDEFVVLSADDDPVAVGGLVRACFDRPFAPVGHAPVTLSCSVGVATANTSSTVEQLVSDADIAMYAVKATAGDGVGVFTPPMRTALTEKARLRQGLVGALERGELSIHLQPLFAADDQQSARGFEALLRWDRPGHGPVSPNDFVPVAEDANLLVPIGHWVLREACTQVARLRRQWARDLFVTVNLSAGQLQDPDLDAAVAGALASSGLPADALWVEVTETSMIGSVETACSAISALRARGVRLALDDFGTGFASLSYLHDLDCQVVKIDRSFVARLDATDTSEPIVRAIVAMAHALRMTVVAEGVETPAQARRLTRLGVEHLQGFLLGRPAPVEALEGAPRAHAS